MTSNPYRLGWIPDLSQRQTKIYTAIADALADDIKRGVLKAGSKLPPQRLLAYTLGVNPGTVHKAYKLAAKRGLIGGEVGRGSFVRGDASGSVQWPNENPYGRLIDFCDNFPCVVTKTRLVAQNLRTLADAPNFGHLLQYQQNSASLSHKAVVASWLLRFGVRAAPQNLLITNGALHAGFISLLTLCRAGDTVLTEEMTSQAIQSAARHLKLRLKGIRMDDKGVVPDHLEELLRKERPAAVYLVPTLQNPTVALMPLARRKKIAALLENYQTPLIEDDIFAPLLEQPIPPIASFAPDFSFYIAGLSKALAPALRLGFLRVPEKYYQDCLSSLRITAWMASPLLMELAGNLIAGGEADRMIVDQRREIAKRVMAARKILEGFDLACHPQSLHAWLRLPEPWRASQFREILLGKEVAVLAADAFVTARDNPVHAVRICLGTPPTYTKVVEGLTIVRDTLTRLRPYTKKLIK